MKTFVISLLLMFFYTVALAQNKYIPEKAIVHFFSETPLENIEAYNNDVRAVIDFDARTFQFKVRIKGFTFRKKLMQDHFNDNYMESAKYEFSTFKGNIEGNYDISKDGEYNVNAVGDLDMHGVVQKRTIPCKIIVKLGKISIESKFPVKLADHKITVPKLVTKNIAESIDVDIKSNLKKAS